MATAGKFCLVIASRITDRWRRIYVIVIIADRGQLFHCLRGWRPRKAKQVLIVVYSKGELFSMIFMALPSGVCPTMGKWLEISLDYHICWNVKPPPIRMLLQHCSQESKWQPWWRNWLGSGPRFNSSGVANHDSGSWCIKCFTRAGDIWWLVVVVVTRISATPYSNHCQFVAVSWV